MVKVVEINAKSIIGRSQVYEYTLNPYIGCAHACHYCYARFVKRFMGIKERWGSFVYVKVNALKLIEEEIEKKKKGEVWISGICDPYQPIERTYRLTRKCLEVLLSRGWDVYIQTKSPAILDDLDLLKSYKNVSVFFTITTAEDEIGKIFEPNAPPISKRIEALMILHEEGIKTNVMIAPVLLGSECLPEKLKDYVGSVIIDKLNYHYADWVYKRNGIEWAKSETFFKEKGMKLKEEFEKNGVRCSLLF